MRLAHNNALHQSYVHMRHQFHFVYKVVKLSYTCVKFLMDTTSVKKKKMIDYSINLNAILTTRTVAPNDFGVTFLLNLALTTPLLPCGLVTLPHNTLYLLAVVSPCFFTFFFARYKKAILLPK